MCVPNNTCGGAHVHVCKTDHTFMHNWGDCDVPVQLAEQFKFELKSGMQSIKGKCHEVPVSLVTYSCKLIP